MPSPNALALSSFGFPPFSLAVVHVVTYLSADGSHPALPQAEEPVISSVNYNGKWKTKYKNKKAAPTVEKNPAWFQTGSTLTATKFYESCIHT